MKPVAIVGAGITGLVAAWRLAANGVPVSIYEAGDRAGGVIETFREYGFLAEAGPNTILETHPVIQELVNKLGLEDERLYSKPEANARYIIKDGELVAVPSSPPGFLTSKLFSTGAKLRLLTEPLVPKSKPGAEESLADFVIRRIGKEFLDYAVNPLVAGIYAGDPQRLSTKYAFPKLLEAEQRYGSLILGQILGARERKRRKERSKQDAPKFSFRNGIQTLTDKLAKTLNGSLQFRTSIDSIAKTDAGWKVNLNSVSEEHSALLLTAPAYRLANLKVSGARVDLSPLGEIQYPPVATHVLGFKAEHVKNRLDGFGFLVPEKENLSILGCLFSSSLFPNRAPEGHVTLTCYVGGMRNPRLALKSAEDQLKTILPDLEKTLGVSGAPVFHFHRIYQRAIPQYEMGFSKYLDLMNNAETNAPGLFFAGNYRHGISISDSILSGWNAADKISEFVNRLAPQPVAVF